MKKTFKYILVALSSLALSSCSFLDIVPDDIATVEMAFSNRQNAERYLGTCYNFLPNVLDPNYNAALTAGDDIVWKTAKHRMFYDMTSSYNLARGYQNTNEPYFNYWSGGLCLFRGVHECNVFVANIDKVPDMSYQEKNRWKAEVKTLKAYYMFWLFKHYGPIPLLKENFDISVDQNIMNQPRMKVDECVDYIVSLLDEAIDAEYALPDKIMSTYTEAGRISKMSAMALKAKVLVFAASPLFNGNTDYAGFLDPIDGQPFFNQDASPEAVKAKWQRAADACKEAVEFAEAHDFELYEFNDRVPFELDEKSRLLITLQNNVPSRFNEEELFGPGNRGSNVIQNYCQPRLSSYMIGMNLNYALSSHVPTLNAVQRFYSKNGVPIAEDNSGLDFSKTLVQTPDDPYLYAPSYTTVNFHLNREPRFYSSIGFDGGKWFTAENASYTDAFDVKSRKGEIAGMTQADQSSATGYFVKKLISWKNENRKEALVVYSYSVPIIRLADLYLMYSEALNEVKERPDEEVYEPIQKVRHRAGLDQGCTLVDTWAKYSNNPTKPLSKSGMRQIIMDERASELAFEGHYYDDIRRWKTAQSIMNNEQIRGWNIAESLPEGFYKEITLYVKSFTPKDYLWPLKQQDLYVNDKLVQNPLW